MKDIIKALAAEEAIAIFKAAENVLRANAWNERAAVAMVRDSVGHGLTVAQADRMIDHIQYLTEDAIFEDEDIPAPKPIHTVDHVAIGTPGTKYAKGIPYGTTHDMDCPGCINTPFTASPRSETYWSS